MKDIVNVMSKFLNLNMPLPDVVRAATWNPAREIKREEFGHLTVGAPADIAVLRLDKGEFGFMDVEGYRMNGSQRLGCEMTVMGGKVRWDWNARASEPWERSVGNPPR
jgi:dihydroorotase